MIAIATCLELPEADVDESLLMEALETAEVEAELAAWDDVSIDWSAYDACIIRSTWTYPEYPEAFRLWLRKVDNLTKLYNDAGTATWNIDKLYLEELKGKGIDVVPTAYFEQGSVAPSEFPWQEIVVKPTISAGSWLTERFGAGEEKQASDFLQEQLADRGMMVQPFLPSVQRGGEVAWVWIDGEVTHGVKKSPRFQDGFESVSEAVEPDGESIALVNRIMSLVSPDLLYARVDLMEHEGNWLLSELELIEPSLFFKQNGRALDRFVQAVKRRIA
jgi:glutathione synthase/RimK-type ligase-like ATP-grasp enzyme